MNVRKAAFAGRFYPAEPTVLRMAITKAFKDAPQVTFSPDGQPGGKDMTALRGFHADAPSVSTTPWTATTPLLTLLPHAGIEYSGAVAGATLKGINLPKRLIILAPNHTGKGHPLAYWPDGYWDMPLGRVRIDEELGEDLYAIGEEFCPDIKAHSREHSIELLLPFLQTVRPDLQILPIVMSRNYHLDRVAGALASVVRKHLTGRVDNSVGIIISSDMNHYSPENITRILDFKAIDAFLRLEADELAAIVHENNISMCGIFGAYAGLLACGELGAVHSRLMAYSTSFRATGDKNSVVGYAGIRVW